MAGERWRGDVVLTACRLLVTAILTVALAVAQLRFEYTLGCTIDAATWTQELVVGTGDGRAVRLVAFIGTVVVAVAVEVVRNAERIRATELRMMARGEVCKDDSNVAVVIQC